MGLWWVRVGVMVRYRFGVRYRVRYRVRVRVMVSCGDHHSILLFADGSMVLVP